MSSGAGERLEARGPDLPPHDLPADHAAALRAVFRVFEHIQGAPDHEGHRVRLERWADQARDAGWPDVRMHVLHGLLVNDLFAAAPPEQLRARSDAFREAAEDSGDEIMLARALGGRMTFLGVSDEEGLEDRPGELARAVAMLDEVLEGDPGALGRRAAELSASYNECAQAYHFLELWELEQEMYDKALAAFDHVPPGDPVMEFVGFAQRALTVNRTESAAAAAAAFLGAGRDDQARTLARTCYRPSPEQLRALPPAWSVSLRPVVRLLDAIAADPEQAQRLRTVPADLWQDLGDTVWKGYRGLLLLSAAVAARTLGATDEAAGHAERSIGWFDLYRPSFKNLAFRLAAHRVGDDDPALRWALHQADLRHESRLQVLAAARARLSSERVVRYGERLHRQAYVDELTGVANRHAFNEFLGRRRTEPADRRLCVALLDLDGFKSVNDRFGHGIGDEVLRTVGRLLSGAVRGADLAVRLGGDEFALLLPATGSGRYERRLAGLVDRVRRQPWSSLAAGLQVTVSVGSAVGAASDVDALLRTADENLYRAKAAGRDRLVG